MAGELKLNNVSVATESGGTVTVAPNNVTFAAIHAGIKTALNASGDAPVYACRAWINFNGTGTPAARGSGGVSSLTDNGTGQYTVTFTNALPDSHYSVVLGQNIYTATSSSRTILNGLQADQHIFSTHFQIHVGSLSNGSSAGSAQDIASILAAVFR